MLRKAPNVQKTWYLLQTKLKIPYFKCDWENNFNHFVNLQEIPEGFYTDDQKQSAYLFFQMVLKSFLSVLIHSNRCKYDSLEFVSKFLTGTCPLGRSSGILVGIVLGFYLVLR
jgi:hypothetical protein